MATPQEWLAGARPRTLPAAIAPVLAGTGAAAFAGSPVWTKALLALIVALALQVGVNYANDYSDGVRGTDADRVGPMRLVGSGVAPAADVRRAAFIAFGVAVAAGLVLAVTTAWWLVLVGALALVAAWYYTGGRSPYGYRGLGELMVFVFFGLVAVVGTTFVQVERVTLPSVYAAVGIGALACAILVVNNLRDRAGDAEVGKRTLAVVLGDEQTRYLYVFLVALPAAMLVGLLMTTTWWVLLAGVFLAEVVPGARRVLSGTTGPGLIPVLQRTGSAELLYGAALFFALLIG